MKIACVQMDMAFAAPEENFSKARELVRRAAASGADVIVLPETWNVGFFPKKNLPALADDHGARVKAELGALAKELSVNLVAGSVANRRGDKVYNTAFVFDREGKCIAEYDKTHLFSPMGENGHFTAGDHRCRFMLDGVSCGLITCYDIRFPELSRAMALEGLDVLFCVAQWPDIRMEHLKVLTRARAIENQMFLACCNSCGKAEETRFGGGSAIIDPWGAVLAQAGDGEEIIAAECDLRVLGGIRESINVFRDRRQEVY